MAFWRKNKLEGRRDVLAGPKLNRKLRDKVRKVSRGAVKLKGVREPIMITDVGSSLLPRLDEHIFLGHLI
jgi:hypothetical protein